jgi:uncharacterized membrane protein
MQWHQRGILGVGGAVPTMLVIVLHIHQNLQKHTCKTVTFTVCNFLKVFELY